VRRVYAKLAGNVAGVPILTPVSDQRRRGGKAGLVGNGGAGGSSVGIGGAGGDAQLIGDGGNGRDGAYHSIPAPDRGGAVPYL
jgi:hypothetical protein